MGFASFTLRTTACAVSFAATYPTTSTNLSVAWTLSHLLVAVAKTIERAATEVFDMRPGIIIRDLDLLRPIYRKTACYGHFGREDPDLTWERTDRIDALRSALN